MNHPRLQLAAAFAQGAGGDREGRRQRPSSSSLTSAGAHVASDTRRPAGTLVVAVLTQTVLIVTGYAVGTLVSAVNLVAPPVLGATLELRQVGSKLLILLGLSAVAPVGSIRRILRIGPVESTVVRGASRCTSDSSSSGDAPDGSPWSASRRRSSSCSAACSTVSPWVPRGHSGPSRPTSSCSSRKRASGPLRSRLTSDAREIVEGVEGVRAVGGLRAVLLVAFVRGGGPRRRRDPWWSVNATPAACLVASSRNSAEMTSASSSSR